MEVADAITPLLTAKRILVLGSSGSGKTTFTRHLGRILRIEPIHLDACFWQPGWISMPQTQWQEAVVALVQKDAWIMDGTYESTLHLRLPLADCLIVLDQSRWVCLWRVLKRKLTIDDRHRPDAPAGQRIDADFLRYVWRYPAVTRPFVLDSIECFGANKPLIQLRSSRDTQRLLQELQTRVAPIEVGQDG